MVIIGYRKLGLEFFILVFVVFLAGSLPVLRLLSFLYILYIADLFLPCFFPQQVATLANWKHPLSPDGVVCVEGIKIGLGHVKKCLLQKQVEQKSSAFFFCLSVVVFCRNVGPYKSIWNLLTIYILSYNFLILESVSYPFFLILKVILATERIFVEWEGPAILKISWWTGKNRLNSILG